MFKKIFASMLLASFVNISFFSLSSQAAILKDGIKPANTPITKEITTSEKSVKFSDKILKRTVDDAIVPKKLETAMKNSIAHIYGRDSVDMVYANVYEIIKKSKDKRSIDLMREDLSRAADWYKDEVIYMFYPDQFGVGEDNKPNTFKDLIGMLDYLKDLGVTTIYIMPFADSPMNDSGFDVKNPKNVRKDLGGMPEFKEFAQAARAKGFKIKADLILNHFSDQHEWFKQAQAGDLDKLHYFIV